MGAEILPWVFTTGWASGINAYAVVLVMGLAERIFHVAGLPAVLGRTDVLIGAGILFVIEMVADKIPYLDSTWDSIHTVVRPAVGATLGYLLGHENADLNAAFTAATGGILAMASHLVKAGTRAAVNTSPEPVSNVVVSTAEDVTVAAVMTTAFANPWLAAGIADGTLGNRQVGRRDREHDARPGTLHGVARAAGGPCGRQGPPGALADGPDGHPHRRLSRVLGLGHHHDPQGYPAPVVR